MTATVALALAAVHPCSWAQDAPTPVTGPGTAPASRFTEVQTPRFTIHGFSDVTMTGSRIRPNDGTTHDQAAFSLGQFDLYATSNLSPNLSFLGEGMLKLDAGGDTRVDLEQIFVRYSWTDQLQLAAGRTYTALGYWNENYQHGAFLQPTVERPEALKFEDDGGILPVHSVGIELSGESQSDEWHLRVVGNIANGRGPRRDQVQGTTDANNFKAFGGKLTASLEGQQRVDLGPMFYRDRIPADPSVPGREGQIDEWIEGGHFHYGDPSIQAVGELFVMRHEDQVTNARYKHRIVYGFLTWKTEHNTSPYVAWERNALQSGDPYFTPDDVSLTRTTSGLRWDINPNNVVKLEYRHDHRPAEDRDGVLVQTAFTF